MDLQSQEAYEMAKTGLIRPKNIEAGPVIYGMKCIEFNPPDFTLGEKTQWRNTLIVYIFV